MIKGAATEVLRNSGHPPEGGYTDMFEIICCDCGDHPGLDYREVSPELQRIRGPYPIAAGVAAYVKHVKQHPADKQLHCSPGIQPGALPRGTNHLCA
jgi:hypothetical protein